MNRLHTFFTFVFLALFAVPAVSFAATINPGGPMIPVPDTLQSLTAQLSTLASSASSLASATAAITIKTGSTTNAIDTHMGGDLRITNVGPYHTVPTAASTIPSVQLSKITLQYLPCTAVSPAVCTASSSYPAVTSELSVGQATNYLNYSILLTSLSSTTASFELTDASALLNLQQQIQSITARVQTFLNK